MNRLAFFHLLLVLFPAISLAQTSNFQDDFSDQDISDWVGDNADFTFVTETGNVLLKQNATAAGTSQLSTPSTNAIGYWEFFIRLDGFSPSDGNKAEFYLMSDSANFNQALDGYMLQAGENGSGDVFRLFKITAGAKDGEILTGTTDISGGGDYRVKVTRDATGNWALAVSNSYSLPTVQEATGTDNSYTTTAHFGFKTTYTSTRRDKFLFDFKIDVPPIRVVNVAILNSSLISVDFNKNYDPASLDNSDFTITPGNIIPASINQTSANTINLAFSNTLPLGNFQLTIKNVDDENNEATVADTTINLNRFVEPIRITNLSLLSSNLISVDFNKNYDPASLDNSDFTINPGNLNPTNINQTSANTLNLDFNNALPSGAFELSVSGIDDVNNDVTLADTTFTLVRFDTYASGDIVINEFLKDPPSGLQEYVELKNTTSKFLNLKNWKLGDNGTLRTLSSQDFAIYPDSFVVVTSDTAALKNVFGDLSAIQLSLPALNNTTDQVRVYDETDNLIDSLEYTPEWGGVKVSIERRSSSAPSRFIENWGDSPSALGGTAGQENEVEQDVTPPTLSSYNIINDSTFILTFSERINADSASNPNNYGYGVPTKSVQGENNFFRITYTEPSTVELVFKNKSIPEFGLLEIHNQTDIFGNVKPLISQIFQYVPTDTAVYGDISINEFMYDPPSGTPEFVEIYAHRDNKVFNLKNWTLSDNSGTAVITTDDFYISKNGMSSGNNPFVILAPNSDISVTESNFRIDMGTRFPTLNNTNDAIVLKNADGVTIDSLAYSSDWGGTKVSLERRTVDVSGEFKENWGDSPAAGFATPAAANQVAQDGTAPTLASVFVQNATVILVEFSERVSTAEGTNIANYVISPSINVANVALNGNFATITLGSAMQNETDYELTISNQQDIFGNTSPELTESFRYLIFSTPDENSIVINEIMYKKVNENSPEFVELFNKTSNNFDLSNWKLIDAANNTGTFPNGTTLEAGGYLVLTDKQNFADGLDNGVYLPGFPSLNDSGDGVILKTDTGETIDSLFYNVQFGGGQNGISAERKDPNAATNDVNNWGNSTNQSGSSAGVENSIFELDTLTPELIFANLQSDGTVLVAFSEFVDISSAVFTISGNQKNVTQFSNTNANQLLLDGSGLQAGTAIELKVTDLADVVGNTANSLTIPIAQPISKNAVVINEILYDPLANSDDNLPDQTEYIELYNTSDYAISLEDVYLNDAPNENGQVRRLDPVSSSFKWIPANSYFLIYAENTTFVFEESQLTEYFDLPASDGIFAMQINRSSLSLSNSGDAIFLTDSSGTTIDSVFYDQSWQNPNRVSTKGVALEKITPTGPSNESSNWSSSTEIRGGTPGQENSIFQAQVTPPDNTGISFTPNPFSPDGDGFEDFLAIDYTLDEADYLLRVRIYDRYGREVRQLADGKAAGFSGSLTWDGLTDDGKPNRVGIYIVLFEAYNSATGKDRTFKETVVIARKF